MGRLKPDVIRANKLNIDRMLKGIREGMIGGDFKRVETCREQLSLLAQLELTRADHIYSAVRKAFDLSGRWEKRIASDDDVQKIMEAIKSASSKLNAE
jgi:hypothetical protein